VIGRGWIEIWKEKREEAKTNKGEKEAPRNTPVRGEARSVAARPRLNRCRLGSSLNERAYLGLVSGRKREINAGIEGCRWLRSVIHCEYSISIVRVTYAIDFEHSQWISERTRCIALRESSSHTTDTTSKIFRLALAIFRAIDAFWNNQTFWL